MKPKDLSGMAASSLQAGMTIRQTVQLAKNLGRPMSQKEIEEFCEIRRILKDQYCRVVGW
jgi:hypothetical protein